MPDGWTSRDRYVQPAVIFYFEKYALKDSFLGSHKYSLDVQNHQWIVIKLGPQIIKASVPLEIKCKLLLGRYTQITLSSEIPTQNSFRVSNGWTEVNFLSDHRTNVRKPIKCLTRALIQKCEFAHYHDFIQLSYMGVTSSSPIFGLRRSM